MHSHVHAPTPRARTLMLMLTPFPASPRPVTTCFAATKISVALWLYDDCPFTGGHNITRNSEDHYCGIMYYDHHTTDDLWVLVESTDADEVGDFRVRVTCSDVPTPAPTMPPTPVPSPAPTPSWCTYNGVLTCNSTVTGDNTDFGSYVGGKGGDVNYIVTIDKATRITATTCGAGTNFDARVWWFRTCPLNETLGPDAQNLSHAPLAEPAYSTGAYSGSESGNGNTIGEHCSTVYDIHDPTGGDDLWLVVDGGDSAPSGTVSQLPPPHRPHHPRRVVPPLPPLLLPTLPPAIHQPLLTRTTIPTTSSSLSSISSAPRSPRRLPRPCRVRRRPWTRAGTS